MSSKEKALAGLRGSAEAERAVESHEALREFMIDFMLANRTDWSRWEVEELVGLGLRNVTDSERGRRMFMQGLLGKEDGRDR